MTNGVRGDVSVNLRARDVAMGALKDECLDTHRPRFVAHLDILGYKTDSEVFDKLKKIVNVVVEKCVDAIVEDRMFKTKNGDDAYKIELESGVCVLVAFGEIYALAKREEEGLKQFDVLVCIVKNALAYGFEYGLPMRGVIAYEELFVVEDEKSDSVLNNFLIGNDSTLGRCSHDVYELGAQMNWSGAIVTPRAWGKVVEAFRNRMGKRRVMRTEEIKSPTDLFNHYPYFLWCQVPFVKGEKSAIVINWNYKPAQNLTEQKIQQAFCQERMIDNVELIRLETKKFYAHTKRFASTCSMDYVEDLPIPAPNYASKDLSVN